MVKMLGCFDLIVVAEAWLISVINWIMVNTLWQRSGIFKECDFVNVGWFTQELMKS